MREEPRTTLLIWLVALCGPIKLGILTVAFTNDEIFGGKCMLSGLFIRSVSDSIGNTQELETTPTSIPRQFKAMLDYNMIGFDIEAFASPRNRCRARRLMESTAYVDPGGSILAEIVVEDVEAASTGLSKPVYYTVKMSRRTGSETGLKNVEVREAAFVPEWNSHVRQYDVVLDIKQEFIKFDIVRMDSGQEVSLYSELESPVQLQPYQVAANISHPAENMPSDSDTSTSHSKDHTDARRLGESWRSTVHFGPQQFEILTLITMLDVGRTRKVRLSVVSADKASIRKFIFVVSRPDCPKDGPFFDGAELVCTDICNRGHYGSRSTGRCAPCPEPGCAVCPSGKTCTLCLDGSEADPNVGCRISGFEADQLVIASSSFPLLFIVIASVAAAVGVIVVAKLAPRRSHEHEPGLLASSDDETRDGLLHGDE